MLGSNTFGDFAAIAIFYRSQKSRGQVPGPVDVIRGFFLITTAMGFWAQAITFMKNALELV